MKSRNQLKTLREKKSAELAKLLQSENDKLKELQLSLGFRKLKNTSEINNSKKYIARIWTVLSEKSENK